MKRHYLCSFLLLLVAALLPAQQKNLPLNTEWFQNTELDLRGVPDGDKAFTAFKPILETSYYNQKSYVYSNSLAFNRHRRGIDVDYKLTRIDSFRNEYRRRNEGNLTALLYLDKPYYANWKDKVGGKIFRDHLIVIADSTDGFLVTIDPLMNFETGKDLDDPFHRKLSVNTRGVLIRGDIGPKFSFESSFYENQSYQPGYIDSFARATLVIPGQGRWKDFKKGGFDYSMSSGYISYSPNKHFNFQAGTGKHFIGDGYRSLLLSDNSFNYPYLRITTTFGRFQYTNLYASLMNLTFSKANIPVGTEHLYEKKSASFQFLSVNVNRFIQLGLFQGLIAQAADSTNKQHLDAYYFQPVIGISALHYGLNDPNHVLLGATGKIQIPFARLYGQYVLDGITQSGNEGSVYNRQGFQAGAKCGNFFGVVHNLDLQLEYNQVRPFTYASSESAQSYTHYGQPLADPLGSNFKEAICILHYRYNNVFFQLKYIHALIGADSIGRNYGQNVFSPDGTAYVGGSNASAPMLQGVKTTLDSYDLKLGYLINPSYNLNFVCGIIIRDYRNSSGNTKTDYIYMGIQTSLSNIYYDF
jgi:hypothetical protein